MDYRFKTVPYDHQKKAFDLSCSKVFYAYFMEMGTGKSKVAIDNIGFLFDKGAINAVLVVANSGSYKNWKTSEIPAHLPDHISRQVFVWEASKSTKEYQDRLSAFLRPLPAGSVCLKILVMNVEAMAFERSYEIAEGFTRSNKIFFIIDESSTIKNPKAKRTKAAIKLGKLAVARRILTGTPVTNSPLDVYSQVEFLKPGALGFSSYYSFRAHYAEMIDINTPMRSFKKIIGYRNLDDLKKRLAGFSFIIKKEECLDLPPKVYETREVELTIEQKQHYEMLKKYSITQIEKEAGETGIVSTKNVLTKILRLHQLICGYLTEDTGAISPVPHNRMDALQEVIEESSGDPMIIWATYRQSIFDIADFLKSTYGPESVVTYYGDTTPEEREAARAAITDGRALFFVGNPSVGGYGLTLTAVNLMVYYSNSYNLEHRLQSEDRIHRIGQSKSCTYVDLYTPGTVEEKIVKALRNKKKIAEELIASNWRGLFE